MRDFTNNEALIAIVIIFFIGTLIYSLLLIGLINMLSKKDKVIIFPKIFLSSITGEILGTLISILIFSLNPPPTIPKGQIGFDESIEQGIDQVSFCLMLIIVFGILSSLFYVFQAKNKTNLTA
jgi:hypothetical protein